MNILVEWGPTTGARPPKPSSRQRTALVALVKAMDGLVSPLQTRSNTKVTLPSHAAPSPAPSPTAADTGGAGGPIGASPSPGETTRTMTANGRPARSRSGRSAEEVSDLDKRIIEHLQADGRRPFTQIAAELGVSEAAVRARTNRLIERGILQVVGVTDPLKLGFHQMAMVGVRCQSDRLVAVAEELAAMPEVDYVVITAGTYDLLVETVCEDNESLLRFLAERLRAIEGVRETETFVYLRLVKQSYQWGVR